MTLFETARFVISVAALADLNSAPLVMLPELAFVGRSNAGKSSVINALAGRRQLAFASKTPGRTQLLNFFELSMRGADGVRAACAYAVDLPGYGFAKVDAAKRASWDELAGGYLAARRCLAGVVVVMDARRPLAPPDEELLGWLARREFAEALRVHLLLNKADQLGRTERSATLQAVRARLQTLPIRATVQLFSARTKEGLEELRATLDETLAVAKVR